MRPAWTPPSVRLTAAALLILLAACDAKKAGTVTASATVTDTAGGTWEKNKDAVPISSASVEARQLQLAVNSITAKDFFEHVTRPAASLEVGFLQATW